MIEGCRLIGEWRLVLDWCKRQESRAQVRVTIEETLRALGGLHPIDESYFGAGREIYAAAM